MTANGERVLNHEHSQPKDDTYLLYGGICGFFYYNKSFLTNGICMAFLLLALLIKTIVFLTRGVLFWFELIGWFIWHMVKSIILVKLYTWCGQTWPFNQHGIVWKTWNFISAWSSYYCSPSFIILRVCFFVDQT
jgi:hypothetical protein